MFEDVEEIKPDDPKDQELHFYYNRAERIAKAPAQVQEYYNGGMRPVKGFRALFYKQNKWVFISLILFVGAAWAYSGFNSTRAFASVDGINFELTAFSFEEQIFTSVSMKAGKNHTDTKPVNIQAEFFLIDPNNQITEKQLQSIVYSQGEQYIRAKFTDFDIIRVDVILNVEGQEKELSVQVKR